LIPETELLIAVSPTSYLLDIEAFVNRIFIPLASMYDNSIR